VTGGVDAVDEPAVADALVAELDGPAVVGGRSGEPDDPVST
jgi:hypothetical protein